METQCCQILLTLGTAGTTKKQHKEDSCAGRAGSPQHTSQPWADVRLSGEPESYPSQDTWTDHLFTPITQGDKVDPGPWHSECTPSSQTDAASESSCAQHKQGHWGLRASSLFRVQPSCSKPWANMPASLGSGSLSLEGHESVSLISSGCLYHWGGARVMGWPPAVIETPLWPQLNVTPPLYPQQ